MINTMLFSVDDKHLKYSKKKNDILHMSFLKNFQTRNGLVVV